MTPLAPPKNVLRHVLLSQLREDVNNVRRWFNPQAIEALGKSLLRDGQQTPIVVFPLEEEAETFQILQGHIRYRAAQMFHIPSLEAIVLNETSQADQRRKNLCEVLFRESLTLFELATLFQQEMQERNCTARELARELSISESQISKALSCAKKIAPEARALIEQHGLDPKGVYYLARLEPTQQIEVIQLATTEKRWGAEMVIQEVKRRLDDVPLTNRICQQTLSLPHGLTLVIEESSSLENVQAELARLQKKLRQLRADAQTTTTDDWLKQLVQSSPQS